MAQAHCRGERSQRSVTLMEYPLNFLREIDGVKKDTLLKGFIDAVFRNDIDVETIPDLELRKTWIELLIEADNAAKVMEAKLDHVGHAAVRDIKSGKRKKKTAAERAKEAGLITLTPKVPKGKLILD